MFFFFKQETAYEMRIIDCSSDVCSSDLGPHRSTVDRRLACHFDLCLRQSGRTDESFGGATTELPDAAAGGVGRLLDRGIPALRCLGRANCPAPKIGWEAMNMLLRADCLPGPPGCQTL